MGLRERLDEIKSSYKVSKIKKESDTDDAKYPRVSEPALVHPQTSSAIKLREDGMIDIFVGTDNGIRIDPDNKTINIIGGAFQEQVGSVQSKVSGNEQRQIGGDWILKTAGAAHLTAGGDVWLEGATVYIKGQTEIEKANIRNLNSDNIIVGGQNLDDRIRQIAREVL